jgi:hypothetical protein
MSFRLLLFLFLATSAVANDPPAYLSVVASTTNIERISTPDSLHSDVLGVTEFVAPASEDYQAYTLGTNYGRVRVMTVQELGEEEEGHLSWEDILVLDEAPFEIGGVVAAIFTGKPQIELSHLAIRSARRGTPNAYLERAPEVFAPFEDQLIRLTVSEEGYQLETGVDPTEAQAWWDANRPSIEEVAEPDLAYKRLDNLLAMDVGEATEPLASRFGGKAANLAKMFAYLPAEHQVPGFAIPFHYYREFMDSNEIWDYRTGSPVHRTYSEYLESLFADPLFHGDGVYRADLLDDLCDEACDNGQVNPALISTLVSRIEEVFGDTARTVRFRSSSNAEDSLQFNGAGLYRSASVCAEDSTDGDDEGPSQCDPEQPNERTLERGLVRVWMSLWDYGAYEERSYYQIPQENSAMAVLVTPSFPNETANGIAFTGDPTAGKRAGYTINVQVGDNNVAQPDPGVWPEKDVLETENGAVTGIRRTHPSSLMPPGEWVLSATQLHTLGAAMALAETSHPVDLEGYSAEDVLLDIEFKFTQEGQLIFKQVRPLLRSGAVLHVPGDTTGDGRVDHNDVFSFSFNWNRDAGNSNSRSNANGDDRIDARDLISLFRSWTSRVEPDSHH